MRIDILCLFPEGIRTFLSESILYRAQEKKAVNVYFHNIRDYANPPHYKVDDTPYGGGGGMVLAAEPIARAIDHLRSTTNYDAIIYVTPDGKTLQQSLCNQLALYKNLLILCGHYKGIDQRIRDTYITHEISIGDYVLTGGEIACAVLVDAVVRLIPGVLNDAASALSDSFQNNLLAPPIYTKPAVWRNQAVPEVLRSGHAQKILDWQEEQSLEKTKRLRSDLLE